MTAKVSDSLARIESELRTIWAPDEQGFAKPHATTLNLIAVHGQRDGAAFVESVDDVAARLGARTFLVSVDPRLEPWALDGEVSAVCRLEPGTTREAVCAEHVSLRFGTMTSKRAASVLEALVEASLPTVLYVGPGAHSSVVDALAPEANVVLIDSAELGLARTGEIAGRTQARIEDLAFVRVRRWREMAARFFDDPEMRPALGTIRSVEVRHTRRDGHAGASAEAELVVSWLGSRLGWKAAGGELLDAAGSPVRAEVTAVDRDNVVPGCLVSLTISAKLPQGEVVARAERADDGQHLSWTLQAPCSHPAPRSFLTPRRDEAELLERAIRNVGGDALVREALAFEQAWRGRT